MIEPETTPELRGALHDAADRIADYRESLSEVPVRGPADRDTVRRALGDTLPDEPAPVGVVIDQLAAAVEPGLIASAGPRFFGFVVGGSGDAALVADLLTSGWDQNAFNEALSPAALAAEDVAGRWLKDLLGIPQTASAGFVTGGQGANTVGLTAARWHVLHRHGWDVGRDGLFGAPPVRLVVGAERHGTVDRAARLLGLGENAIVEVPALPTGAMDAAALPGVLAGLGDLPAIVFAQAGNVNTGAFDDLTAVVSAAHAAGAWVHVDGAFGLWAAASPRTAHLTRGVEGADSWACDGHKWLNVPYDAGYAFCTNSELHANALSYTAAYLTGQVAGREFGGGDYVPESSRRARGFATWAALRSLGRSGVAELVDRCCAHARRFADGLAAVDGIEIANDVVLNQVLVRIGDADLTGRVERAVQLDGTCWLGATTWHGERLLRISVSGWSTTEEDVDRSVDAIVRAVRSASGS
jgi:glutamate/tyrosine decarboxylase-like PLP-dependent enzyme